MSMAWKTVITVVAFLVAIGIVSATFDFFLGHRYPAWTVIAALMMVAPVVFVLWRDRLS